MLLKTLNKQPFEFIRLGLYVFTNRSVFSLSSNFFVLYLFTILWMIADKICPEKHFSETFLSWWLTTPVVVTSNYPKFLEQWL